MKTLATILILLPLVTNAQLSKQDSIWLPFNNFIGTWQGNSEGKPGKGKYDRTYQFILNKKFIEVKNRSTYPPSTENPKGEVHEDIGYISYDKATKTYMLRQFHIEGFVIEYKIESISPDKKIFVFISESIENIRKGYQAKETYSFITESEFTETFELAGPGKAFEVYAKATLKKQQ